MNIIRTALLTFMSMWMLGELDKLVGDADKTASFNVKVKLNPNFSWMNDLRTIIGGRKEKLNYFYFVCKINLFELKIPY